MANGATANWAPAPRGRRDHRRGGIRALQTNAPAGPAQQQQAELILRLAVSLMSHFRRPAIEPTGLANARPMINSRYPGKQQRVQTAEFGSLHGLRSFLHQFDAD